MQDAQIVVIMSQRRWDPVVEDQTWLFKFSIPWIQSQVAKEATAKKDLLKKRVYEQHNVKMASSFTREEEGVGTARGGEPVPRCAAPGQEEN